MKRIVAILAHPDDEGAVSGALAHYARLGHQVALICATSGEAGEISDPALAKPENLGQVREEELRCACEILGISELHLLGYCDSGMEGTLENEKRTAFIQADPDHVLGKLVTLLRRLRPHVIITFEPYGWYGHPDHKATSRYATEATTLAADPQAYPEAGPVWEAERLYYSVMPISRFDPISEFAEEHGLQSFAEDENTREQALRLEKTITHVLDVESYYDVKQAASACHRTQFGPDHLFRQIPEEMSRLLNGQEHFVQILPALTAQTPPIDDLLNALEE